MHEVEKVITIIEWPNRASHPTYSPELAIIAYSTLLSNVNEMNKTKTRL